MSVGGPSTWIGWLIGLIILIVVIIVILKLLGYLFMVAPIGFDIENEKVVLESFIPRF
jgi:hypothetical protein